MADTVAYRPKAGEIPTDPGVYRFRDADRRVLYVGKAKNLRARLSNYFAPLPSLHERTRRMVTTASSVEWTVVGNEYEALQLEYTWIKEFDPPFNVRFRDDKTYPFLAVTLGDEVPRVMVTRTRGIKGARYFGPYTKVWAIRETMDLLLKPFPMRSCSQGVYRRAQLTGRPCLLGDIGKCAAPCVGRVSVEEHRGIADDFVSFLAGNDTRYLTEITARMSAAAAAQDYEAAARYRDDAGAMRAAMEKTAVVLPESVDADIFGIADDELAAAVAQFIVRSGRIRGTRTWVVDKEIDVTLGDLVETVLQNAYEDDAVPPREILVPERPDDADQLEQWLTELRRDAVDEITGRPRAGRVTLRTAHRGDKAQIAQTATLNAKNSLMLYKTRRSSDFVTRSKALDDIREALGMDEAPLRMECYDVSHLSGTNIVASMVVFEDGLPRKDHYRRFSIPDSTDDTESIRQVLVRRLAYLRDGTGEDQEEPAQADADTGTDAVTHVGPLDRGDVTREGTVVTDARRTRFSYRPQLLIVDGGQPQVAAAQRALEESGVTGIQLAGIAKRLEEIWLPDADYPVILPRNSDALFLIQRIRDEAHRFAITYQRSRRKRDIGSVLTDIPGLGPTRARELLKHFGSVRRLRTADEAAIARVKGIGPTLATVIHGRLSSGRSSADDAGASASASASASADASVPDLADPARTTKELSR